MDRAEGGTSLESGEMELMLHRRLFNDDAFGVGEALNETAFGKGLVVRGKHKLLLCEEDCELSSRMVAEEELMKPVIFFGEYCSNMRESESSVELPSGIKLLSMEKWSSDGSILVRIENMHVSGDPISVDFNRLFPGKNIYMITETTLDGNLHIKDLNRFKWKTTGENVVYSQKRKVEPVVELDSKQIRSFLLNL